MHGARQASALSILRLMLIYTAIIVDRVQWFRDRAQMQCWEEEVEILEEEFCRTIRSFDRMAEMWTQLANTPITAMGYAPYTFRHAQMYHDMAEDCRRKFKAAGGTWPDTCSLSELISQQWQNRHL